MRSSEPNYKAKFVKQSKTKIANLIQPDIMKNQITLLSIKEFIIENELTDSVMLVLNTKNFDEVALEYIESNNMQIERPFEILGITIIEDTDDEVAYNEIDVLEVAYDHQHENDYEYLRTAV